MSTPSGRSTTMASPNSRPFLVPPKDTHVDPGIGGERPQRQVETGCGIGDPGAVQVQVHAQRMDVVGDRPDLVRRVGGAEFGGLGDRDGQRLRPVLVAPAVGLPVDQLGGELAVRGRAPSAA